MFSGRKNIRNHYICTMSSHNKNSTEIIEAAINGGLLGAALGALLTKKGKTTLVAAIAGFIRNQLLNQKENFSFETVMSHPSKITFLEEAKQ